MLLGLERRVHLPAQQAGGADAQQAARGSPTALDGMG